MSLLSLLYTSRATRPLAPPELADLLGVARELNARDGITGMLLYKNEEFMQHIEGPAGSILGLLERLKRDARHTDIRVLRQEPVRERLFADWTMGFADIDRIEGPPPEGYTDFLEREPLRSEVYVEEPSEALVLLEVFRGVEAGPGV